MDHHTESCHECATEETDTNPLLERDHPNPNRGTILLCTDCAQLYD